MKRIYLVLIATIAITFVSCSDQEIDTVKPDAGQVAPIIDLPEGATQGRILVKFKPEAASFLDAATTRSVGAALTRSGISDMDAVLSINDVINSSFPFSDRYARKFLSCFCPSQS